MNIVFFIATLKHSRGGHYYSLKTIAESLSKHANCIVINIGLRENKIIQSDLYRTFHIRFNGFNYLSVSLSVLKLLKVLRPNVIHSFDKNTFPFCRILSLYFSIPIIYTKCGGPNPKRLSSFINYMIVFQKENKEYIQRISSNRNIKLMLFPNRVDNIEDDTERIEVLKKKLDSRKIFLRISRIGRDHEESLRQSILLVKKLYEDGLPVQLLIIGYVEDKEVLNRLVQISSEAFTTLIHDDYYTLNANMLIKIADFVIGTGRGLMEAASKCKILLTPSLNSMIPILISEQNFDTLFYYNFSSRSVIPGYSEEDNYQAIKDLINDQDKAEIHRLFSYDCYKKHFYVQTIIPDYLQLYNEVEYKSGIHLFSFLACIFQTSKVFLYWNKQQEDLS